MNSVILKIASRYVRWLMIIIAILALFRGHNLPGGGFIGGLLVGTAVVYKGFAYSMKTMQESLRFKPESIIAIGLIIILLSVIPGALSKGNLMEGVWWTISFTDQVQYKIGTPFIFDIGVFLAVIGVTIMFLLSLNQKE